MKKYKNLIVKIFLIALPIISFVDNFIFNEGPGFGSNIDSLIGFISPWTMILAPVFYRNLNLRVEEGVELENQSLPKAEFILFGMNIVWVVLLYLCHINYVGVTCLLQIFAFALLMLIGNYYPLMPMQQETGSIYFDDEEIWAKATKFSGRTLFGIGIIGIILTILNAPQGLSRPMMGLALVCYLITFVLTYFYAKRTYRKKFENI